MPNSDSSRRSRTRESGRKGRSQEFQRFLRCCWFLTRKLRMIEWRNYTLVMHSKPAHTHRGMYRVARRNTHSTPPQPHPSSVRCLVTGIPSASLRAGSSTALRPGSSVMPIARRRGLRLQPLGCGWERRGERASGAEAPASIGMLYGTAEAVPLTNRLRQKPCIPQKVR